VENPTVNYKKIIAETNSKMFNVRDEYKDNTLEQNQTICKLDRRPFSVGVINVTGCLNVGMMVRSASLLGAENFYIFGRRKFDSRSTVGAENYINIVQYVFDDPIHADMQIAQKLLDVKKMMEHTIVLCDTGGVELSGGTTWKFYKDQNPLFIFGSESNGIPTAVKDQFKNMVSIPQRGVMRSFNVSAAFSIIIWDYLKETFY
jgi:tRNA G18 (ribose-2'-O)-methylase SpoU